MRHISNWDEIEESTGYDDPTPGAYIAVITGVEDNEEKQYLRIRWDYHEGRYKGENAKTSQRAGFWPTTLFRSYTDKALGFFKGFKTAVEDSNPNYRFDDRRPDGLEGKLVGVVLGEEEYMKKDGTVGTRLYVAQTRSLDAIRRGDFEVPALKRMSAAPVAGHGTPASNAQFSDLDDDGELPF